MIVTTTISLVIFTTLVFGTFMALLGKIVVPSPSTGTDEHAMDFDNDADKSHHHLIEHPNEMHDDVNESMSTRLL
jgi:hypothetical protein